MRICILFPLFALFCGCTAEQGQEIGESIGDGIGRFATGYANAYNNYPARTYYAPQHGFAQVWTASGPVMVTY